MLRKTSKALGKIQQVEQKLNYFKSYQPSSLLNNPVLFENKKPTLCQASNLVFAWNFLKDINKQQTESRIDIGHFTIACPIMDSQRGSKIIYLFTRTKTFIL